MTNVTTSLKKYQKEDTVSPYTCAYLLSRILDEVSEKEPDGLYLQSLFANDCTQEELVSCSDLVGAIRQATPDSLFKEDPPLARSVGNTDLFDYIYPDLAWVYSVK